jgi:hypothetical protein
MESRLHSVEQLNLAARKRANNLPDGFSNFEFVANPDGCGSRHTPYSRNRLASFSGSASPFAYYDRLTRKFQGVNGRRRQTDALPGRVSVDISVDS